MPEGVFSLLAGPSNDLGRALVTDPRIKAVGFTGSRAGGLALVRAAAARREPIPVFAEMSSINPTIVLPGALRARTAELAEGFIASMTLGKACVDMATPVRLTSGISKSNNRAFSIVAPRDSRCRRPGQGLRPGLFEEVRSG